MQKIALLVPDLPTADELRPYLERIDIARWYTNFGPLVLEFEGQLGGHFRLASAAPLSLTSVSNCTVGLELAMWALRMRLGARVLIPGLTFVATATAVVRAGYTPVICDVDPDTWLLTPEIARRALAQTPVDAVMPVSTYGCAQDAAAWDAFAQSTGVPVVIDAAGAFGNQLAGERVTLVFSLHATKTLGAGEGGFVISADAELVARVRRMSNFGINFDTDTVDEPGTNAKLSEYHAAVGLAALRTWDARAARRRQLHRRYLRALREACPEVRVQRRSDDGVYSIMPVLLPGARPASAVAKALRSDGIDSRRWYCPTIDRQVVFRDAPRAGPLDTVGRLSEGLLALPFHPMLDDAAIARVCERLRAAIR